MSVFNDQSRRGVKDGQVVCLGIMVADLVAWPVADVPAPGRLSLVESMSLHTGGCAINAATVLTRLGVPTEVIGKVGGDPMGDFLVDELEARGIGASGVRRDSTTGTSATMVMVGPDGERRFVHYIGANARLTLDDVDFELVRAASILHVAGSLVLPGIDGAPTAELLQIARASGATTFLDTVWDATGRWLDVVGVALPYIDYFVPSLPEAQAMTGLQNPPDVAQALLDRGVGTVALKMGDQGCLVATHSGEPIRLPAFNVTARDATGAGDAFAAGFIAGVRFGWPAEASARLANATGALAVMAFGAAGATRGLDETLAFMAATPTHQPD